MKTRTKDCYRIFPHNEDSYQLGDDPTPVSFIQLVKPIQLFPQNKTKTKLQNANKKQKMRKAAGRDAIPPPVSFCSCWNPIKLIFQNYLVLTKIHN